ncbi:MAG: hypothetical protein DMF50_00240 [Acidobacteria bacterium]|nr:MAG: hypothetical protein DMF50_00240 [Acidobacteriota bacterium]
MSRGAAARLLGFRLGATPAALPLEAVREVLEAPWIVPIPGSHPHVAGVALNRGVALPVYDLTRFVPLWEARVAPVRAAGRLQAPHLIVCGFEEVLLGVLGDGVDLVKDPSPVEAPEELGAVRLEYVRGLVLSGDEVVALLDPAKLFPSLGVPAEGSPSAREDAGEEDPAGR